MKKLYIVVFSAILVSSGVFAAQTAFDSMDKAVEVKLAPAIKNHNTVASNTKSAASTVQTNSSNIQVQKFNNALISLDDAQVELRQDLAAVTAKYNDALIEKERAVQNCKTLKSEIRAINKKMKNNEKAKKMINANLESKS
jgi:chromosome segregation ATPase